MRRQQIHSGTNGNVTPQILLRRLAKVEDPILDAAMFFRHAQKGERESAKHILHNCPDVIPLVVGSLSKFSWQALDDVAYAIAEGLATMTLENPSREKLLKALETALESNDKRLILGAVKVFHTTINPVYDDIPEIEKVFEAHPNKGVSLLSKGYFRAVYKQAAES